MMASSKGQYFSFDAIIASIIFILTFMALLGYWFSVRSGLESQEADISREASRISDMMFTPSYFTTSYTDKLVNRSRIEMLPNNGAQLKQMFNSPYNMRLEFSDRSGVFLTRGPPIPSNPPPRNIAKLRRIFVMYDRSEQNETQVSLDLYLYD